MLAKQPGAPRLCDTKTQAGKLKTNLFIQRYVRSDDSELPASNSTCTAANQPEGSVPKGSVRKRSARERSARTARMKRMLPMKKASSFPRLDCVLNLLCMGLIPGTHNFICGSCSSVALLDCISIGCISICFRVRIL